MLHYTWVLQLQRRGLRVFQEWKEHDSLKISSMLLAQLSYYHRQRQRVSQTVLGSGFTAEPQQSEVNNKKRRPLWLEHSWTAERCEGEKRCTFRRQHGKKIMWETNNRQVKSSGERGDRLLLEKLSMCESQLWFLSSFFPPDKGCREKAHRLHMVHLHSSLWWKGVTSFYCSKGRGGGGGGRENSKNGLNSVEAGRGLLSVITTWRKAITIRLKFNLRNSVLLQLFTSSPFQTRFLSVHFLRAI